VVVVVMVVVVMRPVRFVVATDQFLGRRIQRCGRRGVLSGKGRGVMVAVVVEEVVAVMVVLSGCTIFICQLVVTVVVKVKVVQVMMSVVMCTISRLVVRGIYDSRAGNVQSRGGNSGSVGTASGHHRESHNGSTVGKGCNNSESGFGRHVEFYLIEEKT
jgi:hypothetical protein